MTGGGWYHLSVKPVSRSAGRSVVAAAAYRLGECLHDETYDLVHDYRPRSGVEAKFTMAPPDAPEWAHDPERLWNAAEMAEKRKNSTLAREVELALPASVSPEARLHITEAFAAELVDRYGVAVSVALHTPDKGGSGLNHHAHILFTTRVMEPDGLGAKTRILDDRTTGPQEVAYLRGYACDLINAVLTDSGSDERVDHRSFQERGIEQEPTTHQGPAVTQMERRGEETERGDINREIAQNNAHQSQLDQLVDELAALDAQIAKEAALQWENDVPATLGHDDQVRAVPAPEFTFSDMHQRMLAKATAEIGVMTAERAGGWADAIYDRVSRVRQWWLNFRDTIVDIRDQVQEHVQQMWEPQRTQTRNDLEPER